MSEPIFGLTESRESEMSREPVDAYASYMIKTFGATRENSRFFRLPRVIQRAKDAIPDDSIVGFLACALERGGRMTGLMFCDHRHDFPEGLPSHTPPIARRSQQAGYLVIEANTGGLYVVAHWYYQNGELGPFYALQ
ncbi:hypothetical protein NPS49_05385 [Pseudomonas putida]|uniref:hypothetical protein n=2 Tax=Pseudomonas TaxID=286 RepID=UPI0023637F02|nr:hypothetical protein [Pseudomonas putida]MDD2067751.1 hypothetical protein [Pseudomonas putida]